MLLSLDLYPQHYTFIIFIFSNSYLIYTKKNSIKMFISFSIYFVIVVTFGVISIHIIFSGKYASVLIQPKNLISRDSNRPTTVYRHTCVKNSATRLVPTFKSKGCVFQLLSWHNGVLCLHGHVTRHESSGTPKD